ncbi:PfaD family polyunsaturated fatty acid/polyketide biosynthesis protein [Mycolicibacterium gilvum]|uniref:PfaD family polyunsaturated fatty acid/polyketide biosynthesis protein n=1 Tax=Mycolicibacterium gilvum TaxID=1804 RepID=UPI004045A59E
MRGAQTEVHHANGASTGLLDRSDVHEALAAIRRPVAVVGSVHGPSSVLLDAAGQLTSDVLRQNLLAVLPPIYPEWLGDRSFTTAHGVRFPYVIGEMARGIATPAMTIEGVRAGVMAFYGSAGLDLSTVEAGVREIQAAVGRDTVGWGANLIHNVQSDGIEIATVDLFHRLGVRYVSASAFMQLTPAVVLYAAKGLRRGTDGRIHRAGHIFAKVSRDEVARQFLSPAPEPMLRALVAEGRITADEAALAANIPVAEDITAEADSGGHTDNRALTVLLPRLIDLRDEIARAHGYDVMPRVGAAGGLGTPAAVAAAFAAGAAYVLTGSVNQSAVESGLSTDARAMLGTAQSTDVAMAPAADMFEMGVTVQVLKRGTLFAQRAQRLGEFYRRYASLEDAPAAVLRNLETAVLGLSVDDIWSETEAFFAQRDPQQIERARTDPKHRMALVFRWYLFNGAQWAREGTTERRADYQIWCGPAMGAFNEWVRGSFLEPVQARTVRQIALNLLEGAATVTRATQLRAAGVALPPSAFNFRPRPLG